MTKEEKQKIYDSIFEYIKEKIFEWLDDEVFIKTSKEQLGELYYNYILNEVENANTELLNDVIRILSPTDIEFKFQKDYYCALYKALGIKKLPATMMPNVQNEYDKIFDQKYNLVKQKYQSEMNKIGSKLAQARADSDKIKNARPTYSFMRDISTDEKKLYELCAQCNSLRTQKEILEFSKKYVDLKLLEFCDIQDPISIERAKKREALELSKEDTCGVDSKFSIYKEYLEILEDNIDRPYALFFKVKLYVIIEDAKKKYSYSYFITSEEQAAEECSNYLSLIPNIDDLYSYKNSDSVSYNEALEKLIKDYELIEKLTDNLESSVCLRERKHILLKSVDLYKKGEFEILNNVLPIQIEGMFDDYLRDTTTFLRFTKMDIYINAVLKDKIRYLQEVKSDIYPEAVEYFMYYFNNIIRNKIAHGRYIGNQTEKIQDEIFAKELILDMSMLVHMLSRKSETEKMYRFIHGYKERYKGILRSEEHPCFGALFNDIIGNKLISDYDTIEKYRPIQVVYWLVNPYYEKIYTQVADKSDLLDLRDEFLSKEFWEYVLKILNDIILEGYNHMNINMEFMSIVKGLFKCNISPDVRTILGKVNATLYEIKKMKI